MRVAVFLEALRQGYDVTRSIRVNVIFLCLVIPNSVSEARVFGFPFTPAFGVNGQSARVGVRDLLFLFEIYSICEVIIAKVSSEI